MKRTTEFTAQELKIWYGGLKMFPDWIINRAVLALATSSDRFPEFGDVYQICRRTAIQKGLMAEPYSPHGNAEKAGITDSELTSIGAALGLNMSPKTKDA